MKENPGVLLVDPDPTSQKLIAGAFNRGGMVCRFIREPRKTAGALRLLQPEVILVHGELGAAVAKDVLDGLASDVAFSTLPVVLLCTTTTDQRYVRSFKTGVVELLSLPFSSTYVERVRQVLAGLPDRAARLAGQGDRAELTALVDHVRKSQRSGVLMVDALTPDEGKAFFANGVLKSAQQGERAGATALSAILARPKARWTFSDVGSEDESAAVVIDVGGDGPLASANAGADEGISLDVEAPAEDEVEPQSEEILLVDEEIDEEPAASRSPPGPATPILLVDDDPELCRMFGTYFKTHGFAVTTAADGVAGFDAALSHPFEVIVADLNMPRMDGWGMLRQLREDFRTRETPIAFLSCHDDYRESLKALDAGAQAYFSKSTRLDALAIQVREVLEPRETFRRAGGAGKAFAVSLSQVGPQWALRELCRLRARGRLDAKDNWANHQLFFRDGELLHAKSQSGRHTADGERALCSFMATRGAEGQVTFGEFPSPRTLQGPVDEALRRSAGALNDNERSLRDGLMIAGKEIHVNAELYRLYAEVGPKHWRETARLLCEEKLTPREVLAQTSLSPVEVEEAMRDLIRRGVVRLTA